jgi:7,8-dihydro-6-hydroxymethylpterin-pyrophosphokinase
LVVYLASKVFISRVLKVPRPRHRAINFVVHPWANSPI